MIKILEHLLTDIWENADAESRKYLERFVNMEENGMKEIVHHFFSHVVHQSDAKSFDVFCSSGGWVPQRNLCITKV
jgi:hypothetical protein